jgi:hypothetical protein
MEFRRGRVSPRQRTKWRLTPFDFMDKAFQRISASLMTVKIYRDEIAGLVRKMSDDEG